VTGFLLPGRNDGLCFNDLPHNENCCLLSLMIWLLEAVLVAALVSDNWLMTVQQTEDAMIVSYLGKEVRNTAKRWFDRLFVKTGAKETVYRSHPQRAGTPTFLGV